MDNATYQDDMNLLTSQEADDWQRFLRVFSVKNIPPKLQVVVLSWRFWLCLLSGIGAIALSAFRTTQQFYISASHSSPEPLFIWGETIAAAFAVNGTIVALSTLIAYKTQKVSDFSMTWGVRVAVIISGLAGLGQAFHGSGNQPLIDLLANILNLAMGLGVTALEYFGGDMIGVELVKFEMEKAANQKLFNEQKDEWFAAARRQFPAWVLRKTNKRTAHSEQNEQPRTNDNKPYRLPGRTNPAERGERSNGSNEQLIRTYLQNAYMENERILGVSELARLIASKEHPDFSNEQIEQFARKKKGYISHVRTKWISEFQVSGEVPQEANL